MVLGVSYNVFDGIELLTKSIKSIRSSVDYISVIYQNTSNFGNEISENNLDLFLKLKKDKLIDDYLEYKPNIKLQPHQNEVNKRNYGLAMSEANGCTHHMSMDTDEFYDEVEFNNVKKIIIEGDYDSSACQMMTYYKSGDFALSPSEEYFVPFIVKLGIDVRYDMNNQFPVLVDSTRKVNGKKCLLLDRQTIQMHHMSYVRNNLYLKLNNSSARCNFKDIDYIVDYFDKWSFPNKALMGGLPNWFSDIVKVENKFNINERN
jgi:hypothetical protein